MARALALQARGQGFDSLILHKEGVGVSVGVGVTFFLHLPATSAMTSKFFDILKENTTALIID